MNGDIEDKDSKIKNEEKKEKWGSKTEFILTCLSYVIGFGNIWRFPYICYNNGGGAFLIPYILSLIFLGLPLMILEMTLGQYSARGEVIVWNFMTIFFGIGISMMVVVTTQSVYYCMLLAWSVRDALIISFGNSCTSIFAGFVIFSFMGSVAHQRNVDISEVATSGPGLAFVVYPEAVAQFPFGQIFSVLFFFMLILLGLGSLTPTLESVMSTTFDYFPSKLKSRPIVLFLLCFVCFASGIIFCTQSGIYWFVLFNDFCASTAAIIIGLTEIVAISWVYGIDKFLDHINEMVGHPLRPKIFWKITFKYITPTYLLIILILALYTTQEPSYGEYKWSVYLGWIINFGSVMPIPIVAIYYLFKCCNRKDLFKDCTSIFAGFVIFSFYGPTVNCAKELSKKDREVASYFVVFVYIFIFFSFCFTVWRILNNFSHNPMRNAFTSLKPAKKDVIHKVLEDLNKQVEDRSDSSDVESRPTDLNQPKVEKDSHP